MAARPSSRAKGRSTVKNLASLTVRQVIKLNKSHYKALQNIYHPSIIEPLFGEIDLEEMVEKCYMMVGIPDEEGILVGAMIVFCHPNVKSLPPWEWKDWITKLYGMEDSCSRNTLFIHLLLWDPSYTLFFLRPLVHYVFKIRIFLQYLIMVHPPGRQRSDIIGNLGSFVLPRDCSGNNTQQLYVFNRENFMLKYKIRRAVEEDNDDLVPLIDTHSHRLQQMYGSFYIAEILTRYKDCGRQIIVAEYQSAAVAVLCLNETVNYKVLNEEFELTPYNGLKKPHPQDFADYSLEAIYHSLEHIKLRYDDDILEIIERSSSSEISDITEYSQEKLVHLDRSDSDDFSIVFTSASMFLFQEDDELRRDSENAPDDEQLNSESSQEVLKRYLSLTDKIVDMDLYSVYSSARGIYFHIPEFHGDPNAFCLEIAAAYPEHELGLAMLFEAAFECFPEREYCVMAIPSTIPINRLTKFFSRVVPRCTGVYPYELYIMHKSAMLGTVEVRPATSRDVSSVKHLINTIPNYSLILQQFESSFRSENSFYFPFIFLCENQTVGMAILSEETELMYIQSHYDLCDINTRFHKVGSYGVIECILVNPVFTRHYKYFLRELHRLSDFSILFYKHTPYDTSETYRERPLMNMLQSLYPVSPRKIPDYDMKLLTEEECAPSEVIAEKKDPFSLHLSTVPYCSNNRQSINTRLVVVGCSNTSTSFLETLLFKQNPNNLVTFTNVTIVCSSGLAVAKVGNRLRESFLVQKYFTDPRHMDMISLKAYVNVVQGRISKIDRKERILVVNSNSYIPYDFLFLMTGELFLRPIRAKNTAFQETPDNVFVVNNAIEASRSVMKLKQLHSKYGSPDYKIIVYGHFLQSHCTLNGLLVFGIPPKHLILVEPFPYSMDFEKRQRHKVSIYNDPDIDTAVYDHIRATGIKIYESYYFMDWEYNEAENIITRAKFESRHHMLQLDCLALFYFSDKEINPRIYRIINDAGLVYDGRLVIDNKCRTNDPRIYGAGTLTKYSRKYYALHMTHKYFSRVEIGEKLGMQIKNMLVRFKDKNDKPDWNVKIERGDQLLPKYEKPIMRYCRLPGGLYYLSVTKPGRRIPLETAISMENYGQVLITGNCGNLEKQGFFRLHLNDNKRVETITCLAKFPIDVYNIYCLWGKHEKLLNSIQLRFEMVLITDLFEYFKQPWAYALYLDKFNDLLEELNRLMTSSIGNAQDSIISEVLQAFQESNWRPLSQDARDIIDERFKELGYPKLIEQEVLDFIKDHLDHLPMYAHPIVVRALLRNFQNSPLFS